MLEFSKKERKTLILPLARVQRLSAERWVTVPETLRGESFEILSPMLHFREAPDKDAWIHRLMWRECNTLAG